MIKICKLCGDFFKAVHHSSSICSDNCRAHSYVIGQTTWLKKNPLGRKKYDYDLVKVRERDRKWKKANLSKTRAYRRKWRKNNPEKATERNYLYLVLKKNKIPLKLKKEMAIIRLVKLKLVGIINSTECKNLLTLIKKGETHVAYKKKFGRQRK